MTFRLRPLVLSLLVLSINAAFLSSHNAPKTTSIPRHVLPTPEESAKALTDYMSKAHEEKIKAMASVEAKYQAQIQELEAKVKELEGRAPIQASGNAYEMPCTNKELTEKVGQYRKFLQEYLTRSQIQRVQAVAAAEAKLRAHYEAIIAELQKSKTEMSAKGFE